MAQVDTYITAKINKELGERLKSEAKLVRDIASNVEGLVKKRINIYFIMGSIILGLLAWNGYSSIDKVINAILKPRITAALKTVDDSKHDVVTTGEDVKKDVANLESNIDSTQKKLDAAATLQPQVEHMKAQLAAAQEKMSKQEAELSNSEVFVKKVFSSYQDAIFQCNGNTRGENVAVDSNGTTYILLKSAPIQETVQFYWGALNEPRQYYSIDHNLFIVDFKISPCSTKGAEMLRVSVVSSFFRTFDLT
jgi:Skp family chaperone for outer membrane proteins